MVHHLLLFNIIEKRRQVNIFNIAHALLLIELMGLHDSQIRFDTVASSADIGKLRDQMLAHFSQIFDRLSAAVAVIGFTVRNQIRNCFKDIGFFHRGGVIAALRLIKTAENILAVVGDMHKISGSDFIALFFRPVRLPSGGVSTIT